MPAINENSSELLKEGYHHLRHPEEYEDVFESPAFDARLRALRDRKSPPLPSLREIVRMLIATWKEAGKAWDAEIAKKTGSTSDPAPNIRTPQL